MADHATLRGGTERLHIRGREIDLAGDAVPGDQDVGSWLALSVTVLAQCNSFLLHRLVNEQDQKIVGRLVPDNLSGLLDDLPSLPSRHALLFGWATSIPTLLEMRDLPESQQPQSSDPRFWASWTGEDEHEVDWPAIAGEWQAG